MKRQICLVFCLIAAMLNAALAGDVSRVETDSQSEKQSEIRIGPVSVPENRAYTTDQVRAAIIYGAAGNHWIIDSETPGTIRIKLDGRKDLIVLVMDVIYDAHSYSIKYVSSDLTPKNKITFNSSYPRWTRGLMTAINRELNVINL
jgi:hypothetical protein